MKTLSIVLALMLVGCATTPETVKVPVPVKCATPDPAQPDYRYAPPYNNVFEGVRDLLGDREISTQYEEALRQALKSCK